MEMFGYEKNWPEAFGLDLPIFPNNIARRAKLNRLTLRNTFTGTHLPTEKTIDNLTRTFCQIIGPKIPPATVKEFLKGFSSAYLRPKGSWEVAFQVHAITERSFGLKKSLSYSRRLIVAQERAAIRFAVQRKAFGEALALREWLLDVSNEPYLYASLSEKDFEHCDVHELNGYVKQVFVRLHVSGFAALEADINSQCEQDPGPAMPKYMPVLNRGRLVAPVSRYLSVVRERFEIASDNALSEKLSEKFGGGMDCWRRQIVRWRKLGTGKMPGWESIDKILTAVEAGEDRIRLLRTFGAVRYFQMVFTLNSKGEKETAIQNFLEETVHLFGEYEKWYRLHSARIRGKSV